MARKKSKQSKSLRKLTELTENAKRRREKSSGPKRGVMARFASKVRNNPMFADMGDAAVTVGVGFGSYTINRVGVMFVRKLLGNRLGFLSKHLSPMASLGIAAVIWFIAEKWSWLRRHNNGVLVGSGLALIQTVIQTYLPALQWFFTANGLPSAAVREAIANGADPAMIASLQTAVDQGLLDANAVDDACATITDGVVGEDDFVNAVMSDDDDYSTGVFAPNVSKLDME